MKSNKNQTILLPLRSWPLKSLLTLLGAFLAAFVKIHAINQYLRTLEGSTLHAWCHSS